MKKQQHKLHNKGRLLALLLTAAMTLSLAACGGEDTQQQTSEDDGAEYVYVPEYTTLNTGDLGENYYPYLYQAQIAGDYIYYPINGYDEETETSREFVARSSMDGTGTFEETALSLSNDSGRGLSQFTMDADGNFYTHEMIWGETSTSYLCKYDNQGALQYEQDITSLLASDEGDSYMQSLVLDRDGNIYAVAENKILLFDNAGQPSGTVSLGEGGWINSAAVSKDGKVYVAMYDTMGSGFLLYQVDFQSKSVGEPYTNCPSGSDLMTGLNKDLMVNDGSRIYEYDLETQTAEELLEWLDCDINGDSVSKVAVLSDGSLAAILSDYDTDTTELVKLVRTKASEVPQKVQIDVGMLYEDYELKASVVNFNKTQDTYHVNMRTYYDYTDPNSNYEDSLTALNNELIAGNGPDLIMLSGLNVQELASKGVFEDLNTYLDNSSVLSREDFFENVLEGSTFSDILVSIPQSFYLNTLVGKTSDVGEEMGWTLEEMIAYADAHPESALLAYANKSSILLYCLSYNMDNFVNWETGECSFDSPAFTQLLEFTNRFPTEFDWESDDRSEPAQIADGDVLLSSAYISGFQDIQMYPAMFNEDVTFIGYPNPDGDIGCTLSAASSMGITANSANKEGAWQFLESVLTYVDENRFGFGFSSNKGILQSQIEEELTAAYQKDEAGNVILDEEGNPIPALDMGSSSVGYGDWEYTYHNTTQEEIDQLMELIEGAKPVAETNEQIFSIIQEEITSFYEGQQSAEQVAGVIQSRIQLYVNENR